MYVIAKRPLSFVIGDATSYVAENNKAKLFETAEEAQQYFDSMSGGATLKELDCYIREAKPGEFAAESA